MAQQKKNAGSRMHPSEQAVRDQEVLRAYRDLAAYFKGTRTEREARGALKIIKAFVRDREGLDPKNRPPLPGVHTSAEPVQKRRRPTRRKRHRRVAETASILPAQDEGGVPPGSSE